MSNGFSRVCSSGNHMLEGECCIYCGKQVFRDNVCDECRENRYETDLIKEDFDGKAF